MAEKQELSGGSGAKRLSSLAATLQQTAKSVGKVALAVSSAGKAAAKSAQNAQKLKGQVGDLFRFDEINRLSSVSAAKSSASRKRSGSSGKGGGTQEEQEQLSWLEKLKEKLGALLKPLREFWSSHGGETVASWKRLYRSAKEFEELVKGGLSWCYENVLKPLAVWTLEKGLPAGLQVAAAGVELLHSALSAVAPIVARVVTGLKPLAAAVGTLLVNRLQDAANGLRSLSYCFRKLGELTNSGDPFKMIINWGARMGEGVKELLAKAYSWGKLLMGDLTGGMVSSGEVTTQVIRRLIAQMLESAAKLVGERPLTLLVKLGSSALQLWEKLKNGWSAQSPNVKVEAKVSSAQALWKKFREEWGERIVNVTNKLKNDALSLWQSFQKKWASRSVTIDNKLGKSARELWSDFKKGWSSKALSLKVSYSSAQGVKQAVVKALGLSGWPKLSFAARGGVVDTATLLGRTVVGEAGREAIVPLERNTQWANVVADQMAQRLEQRGGFGNQNQPIVVQVRLDGRVVGETTVQYLRGKARQGLFPLAGMV